MLIRLENYELVEYPDELGALVLIDRFSGNVPDFSLEELNCLINGALGMMYEESLSVAQNIAEAEAHYTKWGRPSAANLEKARALVEQYKENIALEAIGYSDRDMVNAAYGITSAKNPNRSIVIEQPSNSAVRTEILTDSSSPTKKT